MAKRKAEYEGIQPDTKNANKGTERGRYMVEASLRETGAGRSIVLDKDGRIIAGNKTFEAASDIGLPVRIVQTDGTELVAVQRTDLDLSDDTGAARKLAYYDNRSSSVGLEWDAEQILGDITAGLDLSAMFRQDELGELLADLTPKLTGDTEAGAEGNEGQIEDFPVADLLAPYPYFGGKRAIAGAVWARFGEVENYVEPFFGSGAMLLSRPNVAGLETVNDFDGYIANFWRAVAADPGGAARYVDWPTNENDLLARHLWLVQQRGALTERLHADPDYFDAKVAGWWCWGACNWIGTGWCSGDGPWQVDGDTVSKLPHVGNAGRGVNRKLPHVGDAGRGVNRQLPHVGDAGQGVNRKLPHVGDAGQGDQADGQCETWSDHLSAMMGRLSDRLRRVRVACGDWSRVCTSSVTDRHGLTAVFLDPPYAEGAMEYSAGGNGDDTITQAVRAWCIENGDNPQLRLAFCGYEPLAMPSGWKALRWTAPKGYQNAENAANRKREIIWFSPHCRHLST